MPKGIGYGEAGKASKMMGKGRKKKKANANLKKVKKSNRQLRHEQSLRDAGMTEAEIKKFTGGK